MKLELEDYKNEIQKRNEIGIRLIMKKLGWHSNDRLSDIGWGDSFGYSIWFERHDWYGVRMTKITFHAHTNDLEKIWEATEKAATTALTAWYNFPNSVPCQLMNNLLQEDSILTKHFLEYKASLGGAQLKIGA